MTPDTGSSTSWSVSAARNEFALLEIDLTATSTNSVTFTDMSFTGGCLTGPNNFRICETTAGTQKNIWYFRAEYYNTNTSQWTSSQVTQTAGKSTPDAMGPGWIPDALIPKVDELYQEARGSPNCGSSCQGFYNLSTGFPALGSSVVPAGQNRAFFVEILVPNNAYAGAYTGTLNVTYTGGPHAYNVTLNVRDFSLPTQSSLRTLYSVNGEYQSPQCQVGNTGANCPGDTESGADMMCAAQYAFGTTPYTSCLGVAAVQAPVDALMGKYLLDHRLSSDFMIHTSGLLGSSPYNWTNFDTYYLPVLNGTSGTRLPSAKPNVIVYNWDDWKQYTGQQSYADHHSAWWTHIGTSLQAYAIDNIADEPDGNHNSSWNVVHARAAVPHGVSSNFRTLITSDWSALSVIGEKIPSNPVVQSDVDMLVPVVDHIDNKSTSYNSYIGGDCVNSVCTNENACSGSDSTPCRTNETFSPDQIQAGDYATFRTTGEVWLYQTCDTHGCGNGQIPSTDTYYNGWPSRVLDASNGFQYQALTWYAYLENASGELYWGTTAEMPTAFQYMSQGGGYGDGTLLYPGTPSQIQVGNPGAYLTDAIGGSDFIPLGSYRLKMVRAGLENYEYLNLLSSYGDRSDGLAVTEGLFGGSSAYHPYNAAGVLSGTCPGTPSSYPTTYDCARQTLATDIATKIQSAYPLELSATSPTWNEWSGGSVNSTLTADFSYFGGPDRTAVFLCNGCVAHSLNPPVALMAAGGISVSATLTLTPTPASCSSPRSIPFSPSVQDGFGDTASPTTTPDIVVNPAITVANSPVSGTAQKYTSVNFCVTPSNQNGYSPGGGAVFSVAGITGGWGGDSFTTTTISGCNSPSVGIKYTTSNTGTYTLHVTGQWSTPCVQNTGTYTLTVDPCPHYDCGSFCSNTLCP